MTNADRNMWVALYRFWESCDMTSQKDGWQSRGQEAQIILSEFKGDWFVRETLANILGVMAERKKLGE